MKQEPFFFGRDIVWWIGIVERRNSDDMKIGRCKVRAIGWHTADKAALPTENLPDAFPMEPISDALFSTPVEGETVVGVFLDKDKQEMLILGKLPAAEANEVEAIEGEGFKDARSTDELVDYPRQQFKSYTYSSVSGVSFEEFDSAAKWPVFPEQPTTPFLARADQSSMPAQINPETRKKQAGMTRFNTATGITWFELPTAYAAVYPFNHAYESESLHTLEFDDTPGVERVNIRHRLGSGIEFFPDGSAVYKSVKDNYQVVLGDNKVGIQGKCDISVHGDATLLVEGNMTQHINGNYQLSVDGDFLTKVGGSYVGNIAKNWTFDVTQTIIQKSGSDFYLSGNKLRLNSSSTPDVENIVDFDLPKLPENTLSFENKQNLIQETGSETSPEDDDNAQSEQGQTVPAPSAPTSFECPVVDEPVKPFANGDIRYRMQLSKYYNLADFTLLPIYPHQMTGQRGLSQSEIVCNLAFLAQNMLDVVRFQFPGIRINCGFRKMQDGKSQHELGEAVDVQDPSITVGQLSKYMDMAQWISENVPFDQLIMEHGKTIWLHISLTRTGTNRKQVLTMKDGKYSAGLNLFGRS